jgi:HAD superfamily hydrolase (TIGR01509 family)
MIRAFIFDVDGTLVDSVDAHARSWVETLREFGHEVDFARVRYQIGKGGDQLMAEFLSKDEIKEKGEAIEEARKKRYQKNYLPFIEGFPGTRQLFQMLRDKGMQVVLASSAHGEELDTYKRRAHIEGLVQDETSKDDVDRSKPHPDIFQAALKTLDGVSPEEALVVGDSPWDAIAATKAGIRSVGVLCGGFAEKDLREAGFEQIFAGPEDLLARVGEVRGVSV